MAISSRGEGGVGGGSRGMGGGGSRIKIDTNPSKPGGFSKLKKKIKSMDTPANKAKAKVEKRALKAANKPTNKVGSKADKALRARTKSVVLSKEETKANYDYYYGKGSGEGITQVNNRVTPKNEARSVRKMVRGTGSASERALIRSGASKAAIKSNAKAVKMSRKELKKSK